MNHHRMNLQYSSHARRLPFSREEDEVDKAGSLGPRFYSVRVATPGSSRFKIKKNPPPPPSYTDADGCRHHHGGEFNGHKRQEEIRTNYGCARDRDRASSLMRSRRVHPEPDICKEEKEYRLPLRKRKYNITSTDDSGNSDTVPSKKARYGHKEPITIAMRRSPRADDNASDSSLDSTSTITTEREPSSDLLTVLPKSWLVTKKRRRKTVPASNVSNSSAESNKHEQRNKFMKKTAQVNSIAMSRSAVSNKNMKRMVIEEEKVIRSKTKSSNDKFKNPTLQVLDDKGNDGLKMTRVDNAAAPEEGKQVNGSKVVPKYSSKSLVIAQALEEHERLQTVMAKLAEAPTASSSTVPVLQETKLVQTGGRKMLDIDLNEIPPMEEDE